MFLRWVAPLCLSLAFALPARAQNTSQPTSASGLSTQYVKRPIVLPQGTVRVDIANPNYSSLDSGLINGGRGFRVSRSGVCRSGPQFEMSSCVDLGLGAGVGLLPNLEAGVFLVPLRFSPYSDFGNIEAYGRYSLADSNKLSLAAQVAVSMPTDRDFGVSLGGAFNLKIDPRLIIEVGAELEIFVRDSANIILDVPAALIFQVAPPFFVGVKTGAIAIFDSHFYSPFGFLAGYTIRDGRTLVDISASFTFDTFYRSRGREPFSTEFWSLTLGGRIYFADLF